MYVLVNMIPKYAFVLDPFDKFQGQEHKRVKSHICSGIGAYPTRPHGKREGRTVRGTVPDDYNISSWTITLPKKEEQAAHSFGFSSVFGDGKRKPFVLVLPLV